MTGEKERPPSSTVDPHQDRPDGDRKPRYEVELLCRTFAGDLGLRPTSDPSLIFWESPDIWIDGPSGDPDQAIAGVKQDVKVHVWNVGLADCWGVHVDLFWCDPSLGVAAALAHPVGSTTLTLTAGQHRVVALPWTPDLANGGHECLVAHVYDPVSDPLVAPFSPTLDRHVAQRNVSVMQPASGGTVSFVFLAANLSRRAVATQVTLEPVRGAALQTFADALALPAAPPFATRPAVHLAATALRELDRGVATSQRAAPVFREALELGMTRARARQLGGALSALVNAPAAEGRAAAPRRHAPMAVARSTAEAGRARELVAAAQVDPARFTAAALALPRETTVALRIEATLPLQSRENAREVYRIVERVNGRVSGGLTVILKAAGAEGGDGGKEPGGERNQEGRPPAYETEPDRPV